MSDEQAFLGWSEILGKVVGGTPLTASQSQATMREVLQGRAANTQLAALLAVLRSRGETAEELTGFARAMSDAALSVPVDEATRSTAIDTCGTGGDAKHTVNVSTAAAFVAAAAGVTVAKHGNRAATSASGSADVLEALGVAIDLSPEGVAECIKDVGIGFCMAPVFHPAMRHAAPTRKELGIPTAFNFLGPLVNPAKVERQVIGVSSSAHAELMAQVLLENGARRAMIVFGHDGLDEITTTTTSTIIEIDGTDLRRYELDVADFGIERAQLSDLQGGTPDSNAQRMRSILLGEGHRQGDLVAVNAAAALLVGGAATDWAQGVAKSQEILASGAASAVLDRLISVSQSLSK